MSENEITAKFSNNCLILNKAFIAKIYKYELSKFYHQKYLLI